ncbi:MAG: tetratricopeptide repeat protein [Sedimentisphaerales bacterium]|nr:tetratricopeptide repeat protein [Sedimentisphaerales bacterium]
MEISDKKREVSVILFLVITICMVYSQVVTFDFINYDDGYYVTHNTKVQQGLTWDGIQWAFKTTTETNWHPLSWLSLMADRQIYGDNAGGFHLTNVVFHLFNSVLLFFIFYYCTSALWSSFFIAVILGLHPLHVESVAWVSERKDVLSTFFFMLTLFSYCYYVKKSRRSLYFLSLLLFILGLMSKPMLVTLPFVLLLFDYWPLNRISLRDVFSRCEKSKDIGTDVRMPATSIIDLLKEKIPFLIFSIISSVVTFIVAGPSLRSLNTISISGRIWNASVSYYKYIWKTFWPRDLSVFYPNKWVNPPFREIVIALIILLLISLVAIYFVRQKRYLVVGWLWFLGTLVPVIGLVQVGGQSMADRYTYIPMTGILIMIAGVIREYILDSKRKIIFFILLFPVIAILMLCTIRQVSFWKDDKTLFEHAMKVTTDNYLAYNRFGMSLVEQGKYEEAQKYFSASLEIKPNYAETHYNLGEILMQQGKTDQAIVHFTMCISYKPKIIGVHNSLGLALMEKGEYQRAISVFREGISLKPEQNYLHSNLGKVLAELGQLEEAAKEFRIASQIKPEPEIYNNLGAICAIRGDLDESIHNYQQAILLDRENAEAHFGLSTDFLRQDKLIEAEAGFKKAINLRPDYVKAYNNLGITLSRQNKYDEAVLVFNKSLQIDPDSIETLYNLAGLYRQKGDLELAVLEYQKIIKLRPDNANARCDLGDVYIKQGFNEKASETFNAALQIAPQNQRAREGLGKARKNGTGN